MALNDGRSPRRFLEAQMRTALSRIRAGSTRVVNCPPASGIGLGNMLHFFKWAHAGRRYGLDWWVASTPSMEQWCTVFPDLRELILPAADLHVFDRRVQDWAQDFRKFNSPVLETFVERRLLNAPQFASRLQAVTAQSVTVNVRRGDYYSDPAFRARYSFDVPAYVAAAMERSAEQGSVRTVRVVSDDLGWCWQNLAFLERYGRVEYGSLSSGPLGDLATLASSPRLVLANSTFSQWGGFLSNAVHGDNRAQVWVPDFYERGINDDRPYQVNPRWSRIEAPSGGWSPA